MLKICRRQKGDKINKQMKFDIYKIKQNMVIAKSKGYEFIPIVIPKGKYLAAILIEKNFIEIGDQRWQFKYKDQDYFKVFSTEDEIDYYLQSTGRVAEL